MQRNNRLGICLSIMTRKFLILYDTVQIIPSRVVVFCLRYDKAETTPLKIENLENSFLIIDDPCEENYYDKKFIKFATAGRHKNIKIIYLKQNHYQQSKWSRTKDLNTCPIIFKSARAIQQVEFLVK